MRGMWKERPTCNERKQSSKSAIWEKLNHEDIVLALDHP
jgi:hypothetical protein